MFVGPVAVTASLFPRFVPLAGNMAEANARHRAERSLAAARVLHRVTRGYAVLALIVPVVGLLLAALQDRLGEVWIVAAMVITATAGALLVLRIVPAQSDALESPPDRTGLRPMMTLTGVFNVLWAAVVVLMIVRPGAE